MSEIKPATSAYQLFQKEKHAEVKAALEVGALKQDPPRRGFVLLPELTPVMLVYPDRK